MFYQEYVNSNKINNYFKLFQYYTVTTRIVNDKVEIDKVEITQGLKANVVYYILNNNNEILYIKGTNGNYQLSKDDMVLYNPLKDAILYTNEECTIQYIPEIEVDENNNLNNKGISIYEISNLLDGQIVSKIQVEFSEKNVDSLSNNAIFINADMIKGYKQTNNENKKDKDGNIIEYATNVYSFETIDDVSTKIRYLGIIPCDIQEDEFIILNYYTTD